jgi:hypothetical protein
MAFAPLVPGDLSSHLLPYLACVCATIACTGYPSRAMATAWFAPFPPECVLNSVARIVSPENGKPAGGDARPPRNFVIAGKPCRPFSDPTVRSGPWELWCRDQAGLHISARAPQTASTSVAKRDRRRLCLYFVRAYAGHALELVQTLDVAILFPVRDDSLGFFLCQT